VSDVSDEDATRMLATCPQQVVHVVLVNFGERHDTRTNGQHYTAADRRPTDLLARGNERESRPTSRPTRMSGVSAIMLRGCYEETALVEFHV